MSTEKILNNAKNAGDRYARDQIESDHFQQWVYDWIYEASEMDPSQVLPLETKNDAKLIAKNVLQQLGWDTKRDLPSFEILEMSGAPDDTDEGAILAAFYEGFDEALHDPNVVDWLADEILHMHEQVTGRTAESARETQRRPGIITWPGHYNDGYEAGVRKEQRHETKEHTAEAPADQSPPRRFKSPGGRTFTLGKMQRTPPRFEGDRSWQEMWPILYKGDPAGKLFRGGMYRAPLEWHATTRELYWKYAQDAPTGIGFDVAAFATPKEALDAWGRSADQILDWSEGKPVHTIYKGPHRKPRQKRRSSPRRRSRKS